MSRTQVLHRLSVLAGSILLLAGCSPKEHEAVVATVGGKPITLKEYEDLYIKSNGSRETAAKSTQDEREKFLDLVTRFRLKLADAYAHGLDKTPDVAAEIDQYKSSLASSFLTDRDITTPGSKRIFDERRNEYRASHILISLSPTASKEESTAAYARADSLIAKLKAGARFDSLAVGYSQDPSVSQNKGDLYYFTAGQMVPPFEDAVFAMKVGEITPKPVRTQFGLHIIRLVDKKPARGEIHAGHIMIRFDKQNPSPEDTLAAYNKIVAIRDSLKMGMDFGELAKRNSGDPGSASKGGDLGWFQRRRWIQPFDEVAQTLKPGELSGIVRTIYGYHIIKCFEDRPPKTFEDAKKDMQQVYQQTRFQDDYKQYYAKLQAETQFKLHEDVLIHFIAACDSNKTTKDSAWWSGVPATLRSAALITFGTRPVSVDSVVALINARTEFNNTPLRDPGIRSMVDKVAEALVFAEKADRLEKESPEFAGIMKEYTDGILLYQIEQDRVWKPIVVNDSVLQVYFNNHRDKFTFPDRVDFTELRAADDSVAKWIYAQAGSGQSLEDIAMADSIRMAQKNDFQAEFAVNSPKPDASVTRVMDDVLAQLRSDAVLRLQIITHPDTSANKSQNQKVADQRVKAVRAYLAKKGIADARITTFSQPYNRKAMADSLKDRNMLNRRVTLNVIGRRAMVIGKLDTETLPVTTDDRTAKADSLKAGDVASPFRSKFGISLVRLNKKDPAREKTFEEAGTEVSSSFQEYESKRLENEWIEGLQKQYPLVEYKEVLKTAFVSPE